MAKKRLISSLEPGKGVLNSYYLPKGLLRLRAGREGNTVVPVCDRTIIVDPDHRFFLHFNGNPYFRDAMDLAFTKEGFLQHIRAKVTRGAEAENPVEWDSGPQTLPDPALSAPPGQLIYDYAFDPFDEKRLSQVNEELGQVQAGFNISIVSKGTAGPEQGKEASLASPKRSGVYYRPVELMEILLQGQGWIKRELLTFPHPDKVYFLEVPESALAKPAFTMYFGFPEDPAYKGVPRQMSLDRPGEVMTLAKTPVQVVREVAKIPGEIFQMKINSATNKAQLYRQEVETQRALLDRDKAEIDYEAELKRQKIDTEEEQYRLKQDIEDDRKSHAEQLEEMLEQMEAMAEQIRALKKAQASIPGGISKKLMKYDVRLQVVRYSSGPDSTLGALFDVTNGRKFLAYTMEDEFREEKKHGETRIPAGIYPIRFRKEGGFHGKYSKYQWSKKIHKGMLHVQEVPGFQFILIHTGNTDENTEGCLLVGDSSFENLTNQGKIGSSRNAYKRIYPPIAAALEAGKTVGIQYTDFDEPA